MEIYLVSKYIKSYVPSIRLTFSKRQVEVMNCLCSRIYLLKLWIHNDINRSSKIFNLVKVNKNALIKDF